MLQCFCDSSFYCKMAGCFLLCSSFHTCNCNNEFKCVFNMRVHLVRSLQVIITGDIFEVDIKHHCTLLRPFNLYLVFSSCFHSQFNFDCWQTYWSQVLSLHGRCKEYQLVVGFKFGCRNQLLHILLYKVFCYTK